MVPVKSGVAGTPKNVSVAGLDSVSCQSATSCTAVGAASVVPISGSAPGTPVTDSSVADFYGVQCSATACEAVGDNGSSTGVVVPVTSGQPGKTVAVSGTEFLNGVDCPTTTTCYGAGSDTTPEGAVVTNLTDQKPPTISSVTVSGSAADPTVTVAGSEFGSTPPVGVPSACGGTGDNYDTTGSVLFFTDTTQGWGAGTGGDCIGITITKWTTSTIQFQFGSDYAMYTPVAVGDNFSSPSKVCCSRGR